MQYFPEEGSIAEFVGAHLLLNEPCLFGERATRGWGARVNWVKEDGSPNFDYLAKQFGDAQVCVANCSQWMHSTHSTSDMIMADYIKYWRALENLTRRNITEGVIPSTNTDINARAVAGVTPSNTDIEARAIEGVTPSNTDMDAWAVDGITPSNNYIEARAIEGVSPGNTDIDAWTIEGITPSNTCIEAQAIKGVTPSTDALLYLKDWHLFKQYPEHCTLTYQLPPFFTSDWLNEVWGWREDVDDDYKFVYMGPAGTWTPFHADVFRSYSWSANICGVKEWLLYCPGQEDMLRDKWGNLPSDVTCPSLQDSERYPKSNPAPLPLRVVQGPGEIIFVPSGWFHQVRNLAPTISINQNWSNSYCLPRMWGHLRDELALVQDELADCRDMDNWAEHCQMVLKACAGMDLWEFAQFCVVVAIPRLRHFQQLMYSDFEDWSHLLEQTISSYCTPLRDFIISVTSCQHYFNFFTAGVVPSALMMLLPDSSKPSSVDTCCTGPGLSSPEACCTGPGLASPEACCTGPGLASLEACCTGPGQASPEACCTGPGQASPEACCTGPGKTSLEACCTGSGQASPEACCTGSGQASPEACCTGPGQASPEACCTGPGQASPEACCTGSGQASPEACWTKPVLDRLHTSQGWEDRDTRLTGPRADHLNGQHIPQQGSPGPDLQQVLAALPPALRECVLVQGAGSDRHNRQLLTFRAFEVYTLCGVISELTPALSQFTTIHFTHK